MFRGRKYLCKILEENRIEMITKHNKTKLKEKVVDKVIVV